MKQALWYNSLKNRRVQCELCPHRCVISPGEKGICRVRVNREGHLYAESYGRTVTLSIDPIEKKPIYHMNPGDSILSVGNNACNLKCDFCQNYSISQQDTRTWELSPGNLVLYCRRENCNMVAFTYTEPITWYEYVLDAARICREAGIQTVMVTNGFINPEPLKQLLPYLTAMNIDLKAMTDDFYRALCSASLEPVKEAIRIASQQCLVEVTNLVIPGENDDDIEELVDFLAEIDPNIPLHFSRYFPQYRMTTPPTPQSLLLEAWETARKKLRYVYVGNMQAERESTTWCPECGVSLIERSGCSTRLTHLREGRCSECGARIHGIWPDTGGDSV